MSTAQRWETQAHITAQRTAKFLAVTDAIEHGDTKALVINHWRRLARFGFDYGDHIAAETAARSSW